MKRLQKILNSDKFKKILSEIEELEKDRRFCRHTLQHFIDTARICYILVLEDDGLKKEGLTKEIIYTAGLLHDIGRQEEYQSGIDHAVRGAEISVEILREAGYLPSEIKLITDAIKEHRNNNINFSYLGKKLYQADKLSRPCYQCKVIHECYKMKDKKESLILQY